MLIITQWLKTNATFYINRACKRLPGGLSSTTIFCATMQLAEGIHKEHLHLILHIKQLPYLKRQFYWQTHNISCVNSQGAQKLFVAVGATPLVSQSVRIVDVLQLCPHVHQFPAQPIINQVIIQKYSLAALNIYSVF